MAIFILGISKRQQLERSMYEFPVYATNICSKSNFKKNPRFYRSLHGDWAGCSGTEKSLLPHSIACVKSRTYDFFMHQGVRLTEMRS